MRVILSFVLFIIMSVNASASMGAVERLFIEVRHLITTDGSSAPSKLYAKNIISLVLLSELDQPTDMENKYGLQTEPYDFREASQLDHELGVMKFMEAAIAIATIEYALHDDSQWLYKIWEKAEAKRDKMQGDEQQLYAEHLQYAAAVMQHFLKVDNLKLFTDDNDEELLETKLDMISDLRKEIAKKAKGVQYNKSRDDLMHDNKFINSMVAVSKFVEQDTAELRDYYSIPYCKNYVRFILKAYSQQDEYRNKPKLDINLDINEKSTMVDLNFIDSIKNSIDVIGLTFKTKNALINKKVNAWIGGGFIDFKQLNKLDFVAAKRSNPILKRLNQAINLDELKIDISKLKVAGFTLKLPSKWLKKVTVRKHINTKLKIAPRAKLSQLGVIELHVENGLVEGSLHDHMDAEVKSLIDSISKYCKGIYLSYSYRIDASKLSLQNGQKFTEKYAGTNSPRIFYGLSDDQKDELYSAIGENYLGAADYRRHAYDKVANFTYETDITPAGRGNILLVNTSFSNTIKVSPDEFGNW